MQNLSPPKPLETELLNRVGVDADVRLACQAFLIGPGITVQRLVSIARNGGRVLLRPRRPLSSPAQSHLFGAKSFTGDGLSSTKEREAEARSYASVPLATVGQTIAINGPAVADLFPSIVRNPQNYFR